MEWIKTVSWPSVSRIFAAWYGLVVTGELFSHLGPSLYRMAGGYVLAVVIGVPLGTIMGYIPFVQRLFDPIIEVLRPIPSPAYVPIAILFLGIGDSMKIALILVASLFPIILNSYSGVRYIDEVLVNTGRTFGLSSWAILYQVAVPAALPSVLTGMRISLAISLILVVISEMVAAGEGIGFFILQSQRTFQVAEMYAGIMTLGVVGYLMNAGFAGVERRLLRWK